MKKIMAIVLALSLLVATSLSCSDLDRQNREALQSRGEMFSKAEVLIPQPIPSNFLARKMLAKYTERQDTPDHPFYIYVLSDVGNIIGYYVAQAAPVSVNAFLSSTEWAYSPSLKLTAPSLDGIYYGGAGASAGSDAWFFFDATTDALVILYGVKMFVVDQPLKLDAKPIQVQSK